jgi:DNA-binding MarR family transcriptional regulator
MRDTNNIEKNSGPGVRRAVEALSRAAVRRDSIAEKQLVEGARQLLQARIKMERLVPKGLLRDSAWDMMLELFINGEEGGIIYVKQLMLASGESSTAALRRIDRLEEAGFIKRFPDPLDRRRVIVELQERGRTAMRAMLKHVFDAEDSTGPPIGHIAATE